MFIYAIIFTIFIREKMSLYTRREIARWFLLIIGMSLNGFQTFKYFTNQLEATTLEFMVLVIGILFNFKPMYIINLFEKFILKNKKNE